MAPSERSLKAILVAIGDSVVVIETTMRGYDDERDVSILGFLGFKSMFPILLFFVLLLPFPLLFEFYIAFLPHNNLIKFQGYDDYYEDEGQEEYEEEGEEEYEEEGEEEEPRKPSKEELEYLELRQKLKESIRKQMKKESSGSNALHSDSTDRRKNNLPYDK